MKEMVAGVRVTGRTDSKLTRALKDTERGLEGVGDTATRQARVITSASKREQRATQRTSRITETLARTFNRAGQAARKYGQKLKDNIKNLRATERASKAAGRGLDALDNRYAGLVGGVATGATVMQVGNIQERFTRLGITAGISEKAVNKLKKQVYAVARADDVRVAPEQIVAVIDAIVEKTGDLKFAQDNLHNLGLAIQATGAQGLDIGELFAEFQKMGITAPKDVMKALDTLNVQGKEGAFTLQDLAALGHRVLTAYTSAGRGGLDAIRELGAALQVVRQGVGSSEMGATAFEAVMRTLTDPAKIKKLEAMGIELFDPEKLAEGKRVLRPINELMKEIVQTTSGDKVELGRIFDAEAIRAFNVAATEYQKTGQVKSLDKFMAVEGDGTTTRADSARAANMINSTGAALGAAWERFVEKYLTAPLSYAASAANSIGPAGTDAVIGTAAVAALGVGGLLLGRKAKGVFGKKNKAEGGTISTYSATSATEKISDGLTATNGITPVNVVNWPSGDSSYGGDMAAESGTDSDKKKKNKGRNKAGRTSRTARKAAKGGKFSKIISGAKAFFSKFGASVSKVGAKVANSKLVKAGGKVLGKAAAPVGVTLNALDLVGAVSSGDTKRIGGSVGGMAGSAGGAMAGAALGSVVPVLGTAVGGIIGAVLGSMGGESAGEAAAGLIESRTETNKTVLTSNNEREVLQEKTELKQQSSSEHLETKIEKESVLKEHSESTQTQTVKEVHRGDTINHFHITQQPGQSVRELAREVVGELNRQNSGALHDGI